MTSSQPDPFTVDFPTMWVALEWIERHCVVPDGFRRGQPYYLYDWQSWCLANFYRVKPHAVWEPSNPVLGPAFHYRRAQIVLPQKAGKGPYTAAHCCLEGMGPALFAGWAEGGETYDCLDYGCACGWVYEYGPGEPMGMPWPTPLIQVTAYSEAQTANVYRQLMPMIRYGPLAGVVAKVSEEFIRLPGGGRIDVVASSARSRLGNPVTFAPQDETGQWGEANGMITLADNQRRGLAGMGGRSEETTNAWDPTEHTVAQMTAASERPDIFRYHPQSPAGLSYTDKRERRRIHRFVYGASVRARGGHIDLDSIEAEALELLERDPIQAERFYGNRCKAGSGAWLPDGLWASRLAASTVADRTPVCVGFDGSDSQDWTGIRAETMDGFQFTPTFGADSRPMIWDPARHGGRIPRAEVHAAVEELCRRYRVVRMYCDVREWATEIEQWALRYGAKTVFEWPTNRVTAMHESLLRFVTDLTTGVLTHDDCPVTARHVDNARKLARPGERYILGKAADHLKIDLAMSSALAHEARCDARAAGEGRVATRRRVVVLT